MNSDTYEFERKNTVLETYEWDDLWWDHPEQTDVPRVAYIGDSISRATRKVIRPLADGQLFLDNFATSKALDNPCFLQALSLFATQQKRCDAVLFNNGLHGWHLEDATEYAEQYEKMVCVLREIFPDTPLILVLTTCLAKPEQDARVCKRNEAVRAIAEKYHLDLLDFYAVSKANAHWLLNDGVHFEKEGYLALAEHMLQFLLRLSAKKNQKDQ